MKKEYFITAGLVTLLFVVSCCVFSGQYILKGCFWWECTPERDFRVLDWELPANLFPEGAIVNHISPPSDGDGLIEGGEQTIYIDKSPAVYRVYRFPSIRKAVSNFSHTKKGMIDPKTNMEWKPAALTFSSTTADEIYIACGPFFQFRCEMVARYQEYVVFFGAMINNKMNYAQFEKIVAYIDKQISSRLYP